MSMWGKSLLIRQGLSSYQHLKGYVLDPEISVLGIFPVGILKMWVNTHIHTHTYTCTYNLLVTIEKKGEGEHLNIYHLENINSSISVFWNR